jgi:hypothetical protein
LAVDNEYVLMRKNACPGVRLRRRDLTSGNTDCRDSYLSKAVITLEAPFRPCIA